MEAMEILAVDKFSFSYSGVEKKMLNQIEFSLREGEVALLCGASGSGKSTLIQNIKPQMARQGKKSGQILFQGKELSQLSIREQMEIGYVGQNTEQQIVTDKVWHELAFGLENIGCPNEEIRLRVAEIASYFGMESWYHKKVKELSGGQKQLLNLASVMVMRPKLLLLDEPCSKLDPIATTNFIQTLMKLNRDFGITILIVEHNLEEIFSLADSVLYLQNGSLCKKNPQEMALYFRSQQVDMLEALPCAFRIQEGLEKGKILEKEKVALTVKEGRNFLENYCKTHKPIKEVIEKTKATDEKKEVVISLEHIYFRHENAKKDLISDLNLQVRRGEIYALLGGNGAGKSTCISLISDMEQPYMGIVKINGKKIECYPKQTLYRKMLGIVPQNPQELFSQESVKDELEEMRAIHEITSNEILGQVIHTMELEEIMLTHPYDLSGGEQQRLAIAKVLLLSPQILVLDEPTKGIDAHYKKKFGEFLLELKKRGITVFLVSHDIEFCAQYSDTCGMLFDGKLIAQAPPIQFFQETYWYTSSTVRMTRNIVQQVVTVPQVLEAFLGNLEQPNKSDKLDKSKKQDKLDKSNKQDKETKLNKTDMSSKSGRIATIKHLFFSYGRKLLLLMGIIWLGGHFFGEKMNYLVCLSFLFLGMVPFVVRFEKQAQAGYQLVLISVLSAIGVVGRIAFYMIPQFKPVAAICMIAGVGLGSEAGFMTGTLTAFISNFFFGQGPWTIFQMIAFGIVGAIGGLCKKVKLAALCILGFLATFVIYGLIMNFSSALLAGGTQTQIWDIAFLKMYLSYIVSGIPMDFIHGISTVFFLLLGAKPILKKLQRIQKQYQIM